jgi:hypothetical protein
MGALRATSVKSLLSREMGEDIEVGNNILTVFQGDPAQTGVEYMFYVGQVRQISATKQNGKKDRQLWLSVDMRMLVRCTFAAPGQLLTVLLGTCSFAKSRRSIIVFLDLAVSSLTYQILLAPQFSRYSSKRHNLHINRKPLIQRLLPMQIDYVILEFWVPGIAQNEASTI